MFAEVFGVFLAPIAVPMLCGVFVRGISRRAGMAALVGGIFTGLALFSAGAWHPSIREMVWIFPLTSAATVIFLALGTVLFPDRPEEKAELDEFFRKLSFRQG